MSTLQMPKVEKSIISNKNEIVSDLEKIVKSENILSDKDELRPYETDALAAYTQSPMLVVLPETVKEVSEVLKYCNENKIKVVPRGAGTGLSGGALPLEDCILLAMGNPVVDYFSLDVEGAELPILKSIPWDSVDIKVTRDS